MALRRFFNFLAGAQQGGKKKKHTKEHRSTQEHTAHFLPGAHVDEATKEEPENEYSEEEEVNASAEFHGVDEATTRKLDNDTYSEEEVVNCSTAETSEYTIITILKSLVNIRKLENFLASAALKRNGEEKEQGGLLIFLPSSIANNFCLFPPFFRVSQAGVFCNLSNLQ